MGLFRVGGDCGCVIMEAFGGGLCGGGRYGDAHTHTHFYITHLIPLLPVQIGRGVERDALGQHGPQPVGEARGGEVVGAELC